MTFSSLRRKDPLDEDSPIQGSPIRGIQMEKKEQSLEEFFDELIAFQEKKLFNYAKGIVSHLTSEDLLQPNDFEELEMHPFFRYEEGVLKGLQTAKMALLSREREKS